MQLRFTLPETDWHMDVDLGDCPLTAPWLYWLQVAPSGLGERFVIALTRELPKLVLESIDPGLARPSECHLRHAIDIAIALGVSLPREALRFDYGAKEFIDAHSERLRALRKQGEEDGTANSLPGDG